MKAVINGLLMMLVYSILKIHLVNVLVFHTAMIVPINVTEHTLKDNQMPHANHLWIFLKTQTNNNKDKILLNLFKQIPISLQKCQMKLNQWIQELPKQF